MQPGKRCKEILDFQPPGALAFGHLRRKVTSAAGGDAADGDQSGVVGGRTSAGFNDPLDRPLQLPIHLFHVLEHALPRNNLSFPTLRLALFEGGFDVWRRLVIFQRFAVGDERHQ